MGRVLDGRWRVLRKLAAGGMGRVYLAEQVGLERRVALKVLSRDGEDGGERFRDRFFREARLSSRLTHPNTVRVFDYGRTEDDVFYIAMEYLEGRTLGAALKSEGALDPLRAVSLGVQLCASLSEAHGLGVVHRDLKPDNLFLTRHADGREFLRVLDFGIAKDTTSATDVPTQAGTVFGSPAYMSPEQILEQQLSPRSDLYSVGAVLYRALTLRQPHGDSNPITAMARHVIAEVVPFSVARPDLAIPASLEWIVRQCLAKDPQQRFSSAAELGAALRICELEIRGLVPKLQPRMEYGRMRLPPEAEEAVRRFEGAPSPAPAPPPDAAAPPIDDGATYIGEPSQSSLSQTLRRPALLLLGGAIPLVGLVIGALGAAIALGVVLFFAWPAPPPEVPAPAPATIAPAPAPLPAPAPAPAPAPEPAPAAEPAPAPAPAPAPPPRPSAPRPAPAPAPVVPAPAPAPAPVEAPPPRPQPKSDLRNPFQPRSAPAPQ